MGTCFIIDLLRLLPSLCLLGLLELFGGLLYKLGLPFDFLDFSCACVLRGLLLLWELGFLQK